MGEHFTHRIINLDTLIQDLRDLGISSGDTVFIKGNLGAIGLPREIDGDIRKVFFEALCKVIGEDGSVMTTAYTSSYLPWNLSKGKVFTDKSPSTQGGAFANFLLNIPGRERSRHPECSIVALPIPRLQPVIRAILSIIILITKFIMNRFQRIFKQRIFTNTIIDSFPNNIFKIFPFQ